ncbi:FAD-dependent oxidoreductase [Chelativorans sp. YIM 93263]|uniref:FAD-dependent oxidoreductase n=1 Tax=Chelativorans sp. YIM 93263 TaxID=2906648 RepID=UPI002379EDEB|nr:FAD-dependent monooxygenase [Chelativorans sp. YIM 93263]
MSRSRVAEIAGAGLAGLAAATALAQQGWKVRVHEKGKDLREIGAGIYLWQNALDALRTLGVYDQVATTGVRSEKPRLLQDHKAREVKLRREGDADPELIVILRTELHRILAEQAVKEGVEIVTNSRVLGADPEGRLEFPGGYGPKADLVVGADGVFSRVRDSLRLTERIIDLKDGCGRHLIPRMEGDGLSRQRIEMWNGGRRIGMAAASKEYHYVFLCCPEHDTAGRIQQPFNLEAWVDSHPIYEEYLSRLPRHPEEYWRPFFNVFCSAWSRGNVCIVGDAAHGMSPNLGQGACVAIVNATVLARAVAEKNDIPAALAKWEEMERPYIDQTQKMSYLYGYIGTRWPQKLLGLRSRILPIVARTNALQRNLRCAVDHKPGI